jgi:hypothetical protein
LYGYTSDNPASRIDPMGLDDSICTFNQAMCGETLAPVYVPIPQSVQDTSEGAGDVISFGATAYIRHQFNIGNKSDECSLSYSAGQVVGAVVQTYLLGGLVKFVNGATTLQAWFLTAQLVTSGQDVNELLAMEEAAQQAAQQAALEASAEAALERQMEILNAASKVRPTGPIIR